MKIINSKTKVYFDDNALDALKNISDKRIMIVADKFLVDHHIIDKVIKVINPSNKVVIFDKVVPEPPIEVVSELIKTLIKEKSDVMIAFGGGSSIDTAKGAIYFMEQSKMSQKIYFIAIPTTSGTGSEVTSFTVISDREEKVKHALLSDSILPDVAILEASFTSSLPKSVIANTGIDVLTHAMEAYVAKGANHYSDALSEKAGELVVSSLVPYFNDRNLKECGKNMHIASSMAGMSFNNAGLGINHSIAHQIGSQFHIPHGLANSLILVPVMDFNARNSEEAMIKYSKYAKKIGVASSEVSEQAAFENLKTYIKFIQKAMNIDLKLADFSVTKEMLEERIEEMCVRALEDSCTGASPVKANIKDIENILKSIL